MSEEKELKPCPFCGCKASIWHNCKTAEDATRWWVKCDLCGAMTRHSEDVDAAAFRWNIRAGEERQK